MLYSIILGHHDIKLFTNPMPLLSAEITTVGDTRDTTLVTVDIIENGEKVGEDLSHRNV